ncbi:hypothetical protein ACSU64_23020 [Bacillaceae bacterium C204]|uniref:hypothetical protein n=1 Tax=Neobacillus sp. 204 TaxID=3383351 RepID=UPI00397DDA5A
MKKTLIVAGLGLTLVIGGSYAIISIKGVSQLVVFALTGARVEHRGMPLRSFAYSTTGSLHEERILAYIKC